MMLALCSGDFLPPLLPRVLEGELRDPQRGLLGDDLQALHHPGDDLVLDRGVEVLGVLPHHDQVDPLIACPDVRDGAHRPEAGVEVKRLTERDVRAWETGADGGGDRALDPDLVGADAVEDGRREGGAVLLHHAGARLHLVPLDLDAERFDNAQHGRRDFRTDAVSGDEGNAVLQDGSLRAAALPRGGGLCYNRPPGNRVPVPARSQEESQLSETTRRKISRRSEGHSDVAESQPFRQRIEALTETEFGRALLNEARGAKGPLLVRNLNEEWLKTGEGSIYEISAEVEAVAE
jgi:hypothetical protein